MKQITAEMVMTFPNGDSAETDYSIQVTDQDYDALVRGGDWKSVPYEIYVRVYRKVMRIIEQDLVDSGEIQDGDDPEKFCQYTLNYPIIDAE